MLTIELLTCLDSVCFFSYSLKISRAWMSISIENYTKRLILGGRVVSCSMDNFSTV